jgi:hypothetical protein
MERALVDLVWNRAHFCCEYCQLPQRHLLVPFEIDHVIAKKHGGETVPENLCLACYFCNTFKGPNVGGFDRQTRRFVQLFNPRRHHWRRCFRWAGPLLVGRTPIGRVTVQVLDINNSQAFALRQSLMDEGLFRPLS